MSALEVEFLPYQRDSAPWMQRLAGLDGAAFLDSGLSDQPHARFDILTALPTAMLHADTAENDSTGDPFIRARQWLDASAPALRILADERLQDLPFTGGLIGYFGYEARQDLIHFRSRANEGGRPQPDLPGIHLGLYQWALTIDHQRRCSTLFFLPECPQRIRRQVRKALSAPVPPMDHPSFHLTTPFQASMDRERYQDAFGRLMSWIEAGDCYQANLAQRFHAGYSGDPLSAYLRLRGTSHSPFSAYLGLERGQAVLSLSPERLLQVEGRQVLTQPIKGTRRRGRTPDEDAMLAEALRHSDKDRAENLMIVDLLRNDLGSLCQTGSVQVRSLFELQSYTAVHHLVSSITGQLPPGDHALELLRACFPGGSITGAPKIRAMEIIDSLEPDHRSVYCGSIVHASFGGNLDSSIAIRTLACDGQHIYCWGGGGIVADSDEPLEYQESVDKISLLIRTLESFSDNLHKLTS